MSVYSGFATRQEESFYNKLLEKLVLLLSQKIIDLNPSLIGNKILQQSQMLFC